MGSGRRPKAAKERTENSIQSKWVKAEVELADEHNKLICLCDPKLDPKRIPMPFAANHHIVDFGKMPELLEALALKGAKRVASSKPAVLECLK